jgi:uncharacterized protein
MAEAETDALPETIPVFPLQGAMLLPGTQLPLNIFEPRYKAMCEDAMAGPRLVGMIQPRVRERTEPGDAPALYRTGCVGRIEGFETTEDGRYLIVLHGLCRFDVTEELPLHRGYRRVRADYAPYRGDFTAAGEKAYDRAALLAALKVYLARTGLSADWKAIEETSSAELVGIFAAICPFSPAEKQALIEARDGPARARTLISLFALGESEGRDRPAVN